MNAKSILNIIVIGLLASGCSDVAEKFRNQYNPSRAVVDQGGSNVISTGNACALDDRDAEENAEADKERRELIEAKNQAESLIHSTEKSMEEHSDKVDPTTIEAIELAISALKEELETEDAGKIKSGIQNVTEAAMKLGEAIYKASQEDGENSDKEPGSADFDDNIVDADFEDLDDEQRS